MANHVQPALEPSFHGEAVARLAGIRQALALADTNGAGPAPDLDLRSDQIVSAAAAGLEALRSVEGNAASLELVERIRGELAQISSLTLGA